MITILIITWHLGAKISQEKQIVKPEEYNQLQSIRSLNLVEDEYGIQVLDGTEVKLA